MSALPLLNKILTAQAAALEFSPGWTMPTNDSASTDAWHNWIGLCQPDVRHAIELIDQSNFTPAPDILRDRLIQCASSRPVYVLFCSDMQCPAALRCSLEALGIGVIHSPLTAKALSRCLLTALVEAQQNVQRHGVFLRIFDCGVFITGPSGSGKSNLALALLDRGHALVADDICRFYRAPGTQTIYGLCPPLLHDLLHSDELGVLNIAKLFGPDATCALNRLDLLIELDRDYRPGASQRLQVQPHHLRLLEVELPLIKMRPRHTENMALLVETAVKNQLLYQDGYDANADLAQRQQQHLHDL